jgi:CHAD domain-containing protein
VAAGKDPEALHAFRVATKKLRTARDFSGYVLSRKKPVDKGFRAIRRIYRASGAARDYQLQLKLLPVYEKRIGRRFKALNRQLHKGENRARRHTRDVLFAEFPSLRDKPGKRSRRMLAKASGERLAKRGRTFVREELAYAVEAAKDMDEQQMHEVRKALKRVFYVSRLLDKTGTSGSAWRHKHIERYDMLQEALGDWHDLIQFEARLPAEARYSGLRSSVLGDRELLEESIRQMLGDLREA